MTRPGNLRSRFFSGLLAADWFLVGLVAFVVGLGMAVLLSISRSSEVNFAYKQGVWLGGAVPLALAVAVYDYKRLSKYRLIIYLINLLALGAIVVVGKSALGAQRWITVAGLQFQPSEFAKLAVIVSVAGFVSDMEGGLSRLRDIGLVLLYVAPTFLLVLIQPDLGTSLVIAAVVACVLFAGGAKPKHLALLLVAALVLTIAVFNLGLLRDYQVKRLTVFLNPEIDPLGSGYNLRQSMIAVGSGRLHGKGLFSGTQSRLSFLPIRHTDFIFAVLAEELGFLGAALLVLLFVALIARALYVAATSRNTFGLLLGSGIAAMWMFQAAVNIGMTIGIMPITGIPLPFVSYGGSSAIANMVALGLLLSIGLHRFRQTERMA